MKRALIYVESAFGALAVLACLLLFLLSFWQSDSTYGEYFLSHPWARALYFVPVALLALGLWLAVFRNRGLTLLLALLVSVFQVNVLNNLDGHGMSLGSSILNIAVTAAVVVAAAVFDLLRSRQQSPGNLPD